MKKQMNGTHWWFPPLFSFILGIGVTIATGLSTGLVQWSEMKSAAAQIRIHEQKDMHQGTHARFQLIEERIARNREILAENSRKFDLIQSEIAALRADIFRAIPGKFDRDGGRRP